MDFFFRGSNCVMCCDMIGCYCAADSVVRSLPKGSNLNTGMAAVIGRSKSGMVLDTVEILRFAVLAVHTCQCGGLSGKIGT
jgi:hypothetical protein